MLMTFIKNGRVKNDSLSRINSELFILVLRKEVFNYFTTIDNYFQSNYSTLHFYKV